MADVTLRGGQMELEKLSPLPYYEGLTREEVARKDGGNYHGLVKRLSWILPKPLLMLGDKVGLSCLRRTSSPYFDEVTQFQDILGTGVYTLNTGYEWGCTAMARADDAGKPVLHRVLDWGLPMGGYMHIAKYDTEAGPYYDINWAGNSGMINGVAQGRFVISINQSPIPMRSNLGVFGFPIDWIWQRFKTFTSKGWLPSHLLRHVFETARTYEEAKEILANSELAIPVIFTMCGTSPEERCIIERMEDQAHILEGDAACTANHWQMKDWGGHPRPVRSHDRLTAAQGHCASPVAESKDWNWLVSPVLNSHSIMAFKADTDGFFEVVTLQHQKGESVPLSSFTLKS